MSSGERYWMLDVQQTQACKFKCCIRILIAHDLSPATISLSLAPPSDAMLWCWWRVGMQEDLHREGHRQFPRAR